ncbi:MAG TPA: DNA topoisomerase IV subunit A [Polyangiaceae bacterium]|nr:DNA topoisomerase IV subunit A [Polyangiaceae bacterium]
MATKGSLDKARAVRAQKTLGKIEALALETLRQVKRADNPALELPIRALSNVAFSEKHRLIELGDKVQSREFFNVSMAKKFMQTFLVAGACKDLLESGKTTSIRDLFYMTKHTIKGYSENTFDDQVESDPIIEDLEVGLDALREELHLFANKKGSMVGPMVIVDTGDEIDLSRMGSGGWSVPSITEDYVIEFKKSEAEFVMLVEKEAVWHRLNEDKFWRKHKCLLLTCGGQATRGARRLIQRLNSELKLPVYVLVDNDPWGLYIYSVVKQGSISLAYESMRMACPKARFLGLRTRDFKEFKLSDEVKIELLKEDITRAKQMLAYPWFAAKQWQEEINDQLEAGFKMEIEALSNKDISFVTDVYIPQKISNKDWLV